MKNRLVLAIAILLGACSAATLFAQDTGQITGTVRDNSGAVVQGAEVKISGTAGVSSAPPRRTATATTLPPVCRVVPTT